MIQKPKDFVREREIDGYKIVLPEPPQQKEIANYDLPQKDQKFIRTELPVDFKSWTKERRQEFITKEWHRRENGYWFYNNGNIEYVTGAHYFYINWWRINTGYPMFVDCDRDFFYVWKMCEDDPKCDGLLYITHRGEGKTFKATSILYEPISRRYSVQAGIQSKTEGDARKIFKKLIFSWQKLPYFFKPIDVGVSNPAKRLEFEAPSIRDTKNQDKDQSDVLSSFIDFESSGEMAYDGQTLHRIFTDEIGKTVECNVDERQKVLRECLRGGRSVYGRGKTLATTTVEEMEKKGGKNCKLVWDKANPNDRDDNGFTKNGLYRLFKPADYGYLEVMDGQSFVDEYGYSDREKAKAFFLNRRKALTGADLNSEKRKFPLEVKDIWVSDTKKATYDTQKIDDQIDYNRSLPPGTIVRGNFMWRGGVRHSEVVWNPCDNGRWLVYWLPKVEERNRAVTKNGKKAPGNTDAGCFGLDPYDNKTTVDGRKSNAASYGYRKFDPMNPEDTGILISEYVNRPDLPEIMWEDMILQSVFYGWEILIENNKIGTINYFRMQGYENYLMKRPEETQTEHSAKMEEPGIPMSGSEPRQALVYATESFVVNKVGWIREDGKESRMGRCYFTRYLECIKEFDLESEWTKFDEMVGAGLAFLGARKYVPKKKERKKINLFPMYRIVGNSSQRID